MKHQVVLVLASVLAAACAGPDETCFDEAENPVACEDLEDVPELPDGPDVEEATGGEDTAADHLPGPDDLDGMGDEAIVVPLADDAELAGEALTTPTTAATVEGRTDIGIGRTNNAERRELLPIGRTAGTRRYVVMRLRPDDLPNLRAGDIVRAAAEVQVTTRCDIGQRGPGCGYTPNVRMQLLLTDDPDETNPKSGGTLPLSGVKGFSCTANEHHCVSIINFSAATKTLGASAPPCIADGSCVINLVMWAYHSNARSGGSDKLLIGANDGNFLDNGKVQQDRGRVMMVRERDLSAADKVLRVTKRNVRGGSIGMVSNGERKRIYSHTLNGGRDLRAGEKFRVWTEVNASSNHRVNLSLDMFLTKNRNDRNGGSIADVSPSALSEQNGTNCSPNAPCHVRKVAVFRVNRDIKGPVFVNIGANCEVPGPGSANVTVHNSGYIKSLRYAR